ncbi:MAG: hypothetical protein ACK5AB_08945 [Bacteroidota bacterium]
MLRSFLFFYILLFSFFINIYAQENNQSLTIKDEFSFLKNDSLINELRGMLDSLRTQKSFFSVTTSFSNRLFSTNNNVLNAQQSSTGATAFIPSVSYFHKSGFGIGIMGYVRNINNTVRWYQTAITPSYDKVAKNMMYGISYSYYVKSKVQDPAKISPFNHDFYGYVQLRKTWLRPSLSVGYGDGHYTDSYVVPRRLPNGMVINVSDTYKVHIKDLSMNMGLSHSFVKSSLIVKNDMFSFIPQISLITGIQSTSSESLKSRERYRNEMEDRKRMELFYRVNQSSGGGFGLRTAAVSANLSWFKDAISISTGYFLGYYFQSTSTNKFSNIFNLTAGVTF